MMVVCFLCGDSDGKLVESYVVIILVVIDGRGKIVNYVCLLNDDDYIQYSGGAVEVNL